MPAPVLAAEAEDGSCRKRHGSCSRLVCKKSLGHGRVAEGVVEGVEDVCWWVVMLAGEAGGASRA
eukprot:2865336-Rhodomonas_salina.1